MASFTSTSETNTFGLISRAFFGSEEQGLRISRANPGVSDPISPGTVLFVPVVPLLSPLSSSAKENTVGISVGGEVLTHWTSASIVRSIDSLSQLTVSAAHDPTATNFLPMAYQDMTVHIGTDPVFLGSVVDTAPTLETLSISAYSRPGVLEDCTAPGDDLIEFGGQNLFSIASYLLEPFGVGVSSIGNEGDIFGSAANPISLARDGLIMPFLVGLAKQRGILIADTSDGRLLLRSVDDSNTGFPGTARLTQGSHPLLGITPSFRAREFFSSLTGFVRSSVLRPQGSSFTVNNPLLSGVFRPSSFIVDDGETDAQSETQHRFRRMVGNAVSYIAEVAQWRNSVGKLWSPGDTVSVLASGALILKPTELVIRKVTLNRTADSETATLELVLPGSFGGAAPSTLPWET